MIIEYLWILISLVCESFPISSSGHAQLFLQILSGIYSYDYVADFPAWLDLLLHGPIAFIVAIFFFKRWFFVLIHLKKFFKQFVQILLLGICTELPTLILYMVIVVYKFISLPLWCGFLITTIVLFSLRFLPQHTTNGTWTYPNALLLGTVQGVALLPGISRFGTTFVCGRWLGFSPKKAFEISFLIEWPISVAAFLKGFLEMRSDASYDQFLHLHMWLVIMIASSGALIGLHLVRRSIYQKTFWKFSLYMIVPLLVSLYTAYIL